MPSNDVLFDVLKRFANTLAHRFDVADVLYELTEHAVEVLAATSAGVSLGDADGVMKFVTASSEAAAELERLQQDSQQGPCHHAYQTASTVLLANIADSGDWPLYRSKCEEVGLRAVAGIPLTTGDRRLGAMNIYQDEPRNWTDDDVAAARVLADVATSYVVHASELAIAQRINEQLQQALSSRIVIEQAKGLLAGERGIPVDDAFEVLRKHARRNGASISLVAEAVSDSAYAHRTISTSRLRARRRGCLAPGSARPPCRARQTEPDTETGSSPDAPSPTPPDRGCRQDHPCIRRSMRALVRGCRCRFRAIVGPSVVLRDRARSAVGPACLDSVEVGVSFGPDVCDAAVGTLHRVAGEHRSIERLAFHRHARADGLPGGRARDRNRTHRSSLLGTSTVAAWALPAQRATANVSKPSHRGSSDMVGGRHAEPDRPATIRSATVV